MIILTVKKPFGSVKNDDFVKNIEKYSNYTKDTTKFSNSNRLPFFLKKILNFLRYNQIFYNITKFSKVQSSFLSYHKILTKTSRFGTILNTQ